MLPKKTQQLQIETFFQSNTAKSSVCRHQQLVDEAMSPSTFMIDDKGNLRRVFTSFSSVCSSETEGSLILSVLENLIELIGLAE